MSTEDNAQKYRIEMVTPDSNPTIIKVIGVGGGGGNAVNRMVDKGLKNVEFISVNTDRQALSRSKADEKIVIGEKLTGGLGAGTDPQKGEEAAIEDTEKIKTAVEGADLVFIASGFGGGTGTGASPVIAKIAKEAGALTIGIITKPFEMEGELKSARAVEGIEKMLEVVDSLVVIPNENLFKILPEDTQFEDALRVADDVLRNGVQGISDIITIPGHIVNVDFADVKTMIEISRGRAHMGIGLGEGKDRVEVALKNALHNPMLEVENIKDAKGILANIVGSKTMTLTEYGKAMKIIKSYAGENANIKIGTCADDELGEAIRITVIATGFVSADEEQYIHEEAKDDIYELSDSELENTAKEQLDTAQKAIDAVYSFAASNPKQTADVESPKENPASLVAEKQPEQKTYKEPVREAMPKVAEAPAFREEYKETASLKEERVAPKREENIASQTVGTSEEIAMNDAVVQAENTMRQATAIYEDAVAANEQEAKVREPVAPSRTLFDTISDEDMYEHTERGELGSKLSFSQDIDIPAFLRKQAVSRGRKPGQS